MPGIGRVHVYDAPALLNLLGGFTTGGGRVITQGLEISPLHPGSSILVDPGATIVENVRVRFPMGHTYAGDFWLHASLVAGTAEHALVTIVKHTIGGDDAFNIAARYGGERLGESRVFTHGSTGDGSTRGSGVGRILVPAGRPLQVGEDTQFGTWRLAKIACSKPAAPAENGLDVLLDPLGPGEEVTCVLTNHRWDVSPLRSLASLLLPEAVNPVNTFGLLPGQRVIVAGSNRFGIRDVATDNVPVAGSRRLSFVGESINNLYGALVAPRRQLESATVRCGRMAARERREVADVAIIRHQQLRPGAAAGA